MNIGKSLEAAISALRDTINKSTYGKTIVGHEQVPILSTGSGSILNFVPAGTTKAVFITETAGVATAAPTLSGRYSFRVPGVGVSISSISGSGSIVTVNTLGAHNLTTGMLVNILGVSVAGYNGTSIAVASTPTATQFTYSNTTTAAATGGQVTLGNLPAIGGYAIGKSGIPFYDNIPFTIEAGADSLRTLIFVNTDATVRALKVTYFK